MKRSLLLLTVLAVACTAKVNDNPVTDPADYVPLLPASPISQKEKYSKAIVTSYGKKRSLTV